MASKLIGRVSRLELSRPTPLVPPVIRDTDTPEQAVTKYKMLVQMGGAIKASPDEQAEIDRLTPEQASEIYYTACLGARPTLEPECEATPVVEPNGEDISPATQGLEPEPDGYEWLDGYEEWQAAHPDKLFADCHQGWPPEPLPEEPPTPQVSAHLNDEDLLLY